MDIVKEPYLASQSCFVNEYVIRGVAFRLPKAPPAAVAGPPTTPTPTTGPTAASTGAAPPIEAYALADQVYAVLGRTHPTALDAWAADVRAVWTRMSAGASPDLVVTAARAGAEKVGKDGDLATILAAGFGS